MVKNTSGGSKTKSFARKLQHEVPTSGLRMPENEYELIGCVYRMLGNGRMLIRTAHSTLSEIQCVIRNKFRGRSKRNHMVTVGTFVLIGLYEWEAPSYKTSDLLHVYTTENVVVLKANPAWSLSSLDAFVHQYTTSAGVTDQDFTFSHEEMSHPGGGDTKKGGSVLESDAMCAAEDPMDMDFDAI